MKAIYLISLIIIFKIKCEKRTKNINDKVCTDDLFNIKDCAGIHPTKKGCEDSKCCYYDNEKLIRVILCFEPSCIEGCQKCDNLETCKECKEGYYITEDTKKCYNSDINYYYLDNKVLRRCHSNCLRCYSTSKNEQNEIYDSIKINMNCISCKNNYYQLYGTYNCYDSSFENEGYYLKENIYYPCEDNCLTCSDKKIGESNNCITCDNSKNLFLVKDLNNCENDNYSGYYLDNKENILKKCYFSCKECADYLKYINNKENHNCIKCNDNYYKLGENNCYNNETVIEGYYLDTDENPYLWKECYERCGACNKSGNYTNMNCLSCKTNLIDSRTSKPYKFLLTNNGNCKEGCPNNLYLTIEGECASNCPSNYYKFSYNHTCLKSCPNNYELNNDQNKCIIKSFDQTISPEEFKSQITENITSFINNSTLINGSDFIAIILTTDNMDPKEQIKKGISAIDLGDCTQIIKKYYNISENESLIILNMESKRNDTKNEEKDNDNSFNLGKNVQLEIYDMSGRKLNLSVCDKDITVMKYIGDIEELDIESAMNLADKGIDVFNPNDDYFNNLCQDYYNSDGKDIIIKDRRADKFQNATFCQEGCTYYGINVELKTANCKCDSNLIQNDLENDDIESNNNNKEEKLNFDTLTESFLTSLLDFNINPFYCYNLVFNIKIFKNNIGFYFMFIIFVIQLILFFVYLIKKVKPLRYFMLIFSNKKNQPEIKAFPPKNNTNLNLIKNDNKDKKPIIESNINDIIMNKFESDENKNNLKNKIKGNCILIEDEKNSENSYKSKGKLQLLNVENDSSNICENKGLLNLKSIFSSSNIKNKNENNKQKKKGKLIFSNNFAPIVNIQTPIININNENKISASEKNKTKKIKSEDNNIYSKKKLIKDRINENKNNNLEKIKDKYNIDTIGEDINKKTNNEIAINQGIISLFRSDEDLLDMDYEYAIIYDKRSYLRIYWSFLVDTQIILGTFCTENYLQLFVIKLSFLICTFQISFFLNALFYTDEYISDAYHNDGVLDFFSGLPKTIYSFVATLVTTNLLRMLSNNKNELKKIIRTKSKTKNYLYIINIKLNILRQKLIVYFILVFLLGLLFLYYVTAFCSIYHYSQKYWFIGCLESLGLDFLVAIIACVFIALFRYISIKKHIKCLYILANIISTFL